MLKLSQCPTFPLTLPTVSPKVRTQGIKLIAEGVGIVALAALEVVNQQYLGSKSPLSTLNWIAMGMLGQSALQTVLPWKATEALNNFLTSYSLDAVFGLVALAENPISPYHLRHMVAILKGLGISFDWIGWQIYPILLAGFVGPTVARELFRLLCVKENVDYQERTEPYQMLLPQPDRLGRGWREHLCTFSFDATTALLGVVCVLVGSKAIPSSFNPLFLNRLAALGNILIVWGGGWVFYRALIHLRIEAINRWVTGAEFPEAWAKRFPRARLIEWNDFLFSFLIGAFIQGPNSWGYWLAGFSFLIKHIGLALDFTYQPPPAPFPHQPGAWLDALYRPFFPWGLEATVRPQSWPKLAGKMLFRLLYFWPFFWILIQEMYLEKVLKLRGILGLFLGGALLAMLVTHWFKRHYGDYGHHPLFRFLYFFLCVFTDPQTLFFAVNQFIDDTALDKASPSVFTFMTLAWLCYAGSFGGGHRALQDTHEGGFASTSALASLLAGTYTGAAWQV